MISAFISAWGRISRVRRASSSKNRRFMVLAGGWQSTRWPISFSIFQSIVFSNIFLFISIALFILVALTIGIYSLYYFFALIIFELITGILLLYASINLLILRKKYNGSKNVFYWLILIINSIGMFGMFLLTGISFIFLGSLILLGIGILFMVGSVVVLVFLIRGLLKGNQIMQYQREI